MQQLYTFLRYTLSMLDYAVVSRFESNFEMIKLYIKIEERIVSYGIREYKERKIFYVTKDYNSLCQPFNVSHERKTYFYSSFIKPKSFKCNH